MVQRKDGYASPKTVSSKAPHSQFRSIVSVAGYPPNSSNIEGLGPCNTHETVSFAVFFWENEIVRVFNMQMVGFNQVYRHGAAHASKTFVKCQDR